MQRNKKNFIVLNISRLMYRTYRSVKWTIFYMEKKTFEQREVEFLDYLKLRKLKATILVPEIEEFNKDKILGRIY